MVGTMASIRQSVAAVDQLDTATVGAADHPDPGIARRVELDAGPGGHPVDQGADVARLVVGAVDLGLAAGLAEAAGIPGEDVVPGRPEGLDRDPAEDARPLGVGVPGQAPSRAHEDGR